MSDKPVAAELQACGLRRLADNRGGQEIRVSADRLLAAMGPEYLHRFFPELVCAPGKTPPR